MESKFWYIIIPLLASHIEQGEMTWLGGKVFNIDGETFWWRDDHSRPQSYLALLASEARRTRASSSGLAGQEGSGDENAR